MAHQRAMTGGTSKTIAAPKLLALLLTALVLLVVIFFLRSS